MTSKLNSKFNNVFADSVVDGNILLLKTLLENGADPNFRMLDQFRTPLLSLACIEGQHDAVQLLIAFGADLNATDDLGRTALIYATSVNDSKSVKFLIEAAANRELEDRQGFSAKFVAIYRGLRRLAKVISEPA